MHAFITQEQKRLRYALEQEFSVLKIYSSSCSPSANMPDYNFLVNPKTLISCFRCVIRVAAELCRIQGAKLGFQHQMTFGPHNKYGQQDVMSCSRAVHFYFKRRPLERHSIVNT